MFRLIRQRRAGLIWLALCALVAVPTLVLSGSRTFARRGQTTETADFEARPGTFPSWLASQTGSQASDAAQNPLDRLALLLVDVQNDFWNPAYAADFPDFERNVRQLLKVCRREGIEVIHLRSQWEPDGSDWPLSFKVLGREEMPCIRGTVGAQPAEFALQQPGEQVFLKHSFDGFSNEGLSRYLKAKGKRQLLVAGLYTEICVLSTSFGAVNRGYAVTLVDDCCAAKPDGHLFALAHYEGIVFDRISHDRIAAELPNWARSLAQNGR